MLGINFHEISFFFFSKNSFHACLRDMSGSLPYTDICTTQITPLEISDYEGLKVYPTNSKKAGNYKHKVSHIV